jgi:hypothetical protein
MLSHGSAAALLILCAYTAILSVIALALFFRRDVT